MKRKVVSAFALLMMLAMTMSACGNAAGDTDTEAGTQTESDVVENSTTLPETETDTEESKYPQVGSVSYSGSFELKNSKVTVSKLSAFNDVAFKGGETIVGDTSGEGYQALRATLDKIVAGMRTDGALEESQSGYIVRDNAIILDWDASKAGTEVELRVDAEKKEFYLFIKGFCIYFSSKLYPTLHTIYSFL